jgi:hypothetical protein
MTISGAIVQQCPPRTGTAWQDRNRESERRRDDARGDASPACELSYAPPPPQQPGTGRILDVTV